MIDFLIIGHFLDSGHFHYPGLGDQYFLKFSLKYGHRTLLLIRIRALVSFSRLTIVKQFINDIVVVKLLLEMIGLISLLHSHNPIFFVFQVYQGELKKFRRSVDPTLNVTSFYYVPYESRQWLGRRINELSQLYELLLTIVPQRIEVILLKNQQALSSRNITNNTLGMIFC